MWAPTAAYVEVCLELFLRRVADVWDESRFRDYFVRVYWQKKDVEKAVYGQKQIWLPEWWSGVSAERPGFLSSQQPAEEINCSLNSVGNVRVCVCVCVCLFFCFLGCHAFVCVCLCVSSSCFDATHLA